jgi:hypothetical protein
MSQASRPCPDCGGEQVFEPYHDPPGSCPDCPGGECPEWACARCGAAVWAGPPLPRPAPAAGLPLPSPAPATGQPLPRPVPLAPGTPGLVA